MAGLDFSGFFEINVGVVRVAHTPQFPTKPETALRNRIAFKHSVETAGSTASLFNAQRKLPNQAMPNMRRAPHISRFGAIRSTLRLTRFS